MDRNDESFADLTSPSLQFHAIIAVVLKVLVEIAMACAARISFLINCGWCSSAGLLNEESHYQYQHIYFKSFKAS